MDNKSIVNSELFGLFRSAIQTHEFDPDPYLSFQERYLVYRLCLSHVYQFYFSLNGEEVFQFGIEMERKSNYQNYVTEHKNTYPPSFFEGEIDIRRVKEITVKGVAFSVYYFQKITEFKNLEAIFVIPLVTQEILEELRKIFVFGLKNYHPKQIQPKRLLPLYSNFKEKLRESILSYPYQDRVQGVLTLFRLEDLKIYNEKMGEYFTGNLMNEICTTISSHLKKHDLIIVINHRSYLTYLPDCTVEIVQKRFSEVFFKLHQLIIKFNLEFFEVGQSNIQNPNFIDDLFV